MPDGQHSATSWNRSSYQDSPPVYTPPVALILNGLETTEIALKEPQVTVCSAFLRFLICEFARTALFDASFYAASYPDVEAARLAGDVPGLHEHFIEQGYFERRLPRDLPFDPSYYVSEYHDLARAFDEHDVATLRAHFVNHGWQEGRVGVPEQRDAAERWVAAAHK